MVLYMQNFVMTLLCNFQVKINTSVNIIINTFCDEIITTVIALKLKYEFLYIYFLVTYAINEIL